MIEMVGEAKTPTGCYLLLIKLSEEEKMKVGKLGTFSFQPGIYCYVGSGMNGLDQRVRRHLSEDKKKYWHVDYFLEEGEVIATVKVRTEKDMECELNRFISNLAEATPAKGFGSSDCNCESHLHLLQKLQHSGSCKV